MKEAKDGEPGEVVRRKIEVPRWGRGERLAALTGMLLHRPGRLFSLSTFVESLGAAKSTLSEDLVVVGETLASLGLGRVESLPGVAGGVRLRPEFRPEQAWELAWDLASQLAAGDRVLPGGFLYLVDLIFSPALAEEVGRLLAALFWDRRPEAVLTLETKGIPLALMTARWLGVPTVAVRRDSHITEGSAVGINYLSGSTGRVETMSLPRRALEEGKRLLIVDDFLKAGSAARGLRELAAEFRAQVVGIAVLVETAQPERKLVEDYISLLSLEEVDSQQRRVVIRPSRRLAAALGREGEI